MNSNELKIIMKLALSDDYIFPDSNSSWGFNYTGKDEFLLSDGAFTYLGKPILMFKYKDMIESVGKELYNEIITQTLTKEK